MSLYSGRHPSCRNGIPTPRTGLVFLPRITSSNATDSLAEPLSPRVQHWDHLGPSTDFPPRLANSTPTLWVQLALKNTKTQTLVPPKDATSIGFSGWRPPPPTNEWPLQSILHGCPCCFEVTWVLPNLILYLIPKPFQFAVFMWVRSAQWQAVSYKRARVSGSVHLGEDKKHRVGTSAPCKTRQVTFSISWEKTFVVPVG